DCLVERHDLSIELLFVHRSKDLAHSRSRFQAQFEQVSAEEKRSRSAMLDAERPRALEKPVHGRAIELAGLAAETVRFRESREQLQIDFLREPAEGAVPDLVAHLEP